jgi:hypothetical protein
MRDPGGANFFLRELHDKLWHSTHPERFLGIMQCGSILPEPNIPNCDRWKTVRGPEFYPYVRFIGGVSLFDFRRFDPQAYQATCPLSNWHEFVPCREDWPGAVWIEIDRGQLGPDFVPGDELVVRWKSDKAYRHTLMPQIEAAYLGPLPRAAFKRALLVCPTGEQLHDLQMRDFDRLAYEALIEECQASGRK